MNNEPNNLNTQMQHALAGIAATIRAGDGYAVLSGDVGSGKTAAAHELLRQLRGGCSCALIADATLEPSMMLRSILTGFGVKPNDGDDSVLIHQLKAVLVERHNQGIRCAAMFDDAHTFSPDMIHWLCELGYHRATNTKLLQIVLIGRNALLHTLRHAHIEPFLQRTSSWYRLAAPAPAPMQPPSAADYQPAPAPSVQEALPASSPVISGQWQRVAAAVVIAAVAIGAAAFGLIGGRTQVMYGQDAQPALETPAAPQPKVRDPQPAPQIAPVQATPMPAQAEHLPMAMLPTIQLPEAQPTIQPAQPQPQPAAEPAIEPQAPEISISRRDIDGEVALPAPAPRSIEPRASVDDAWSLFNARTDPDPNASRAAIVPAAVRDAPVAAAAPPQGNAPAVWIGGFATQEDAQVAARSAMFHLQRAGGAAQAQGFVAVQNDADPEQRFVALLGGFTDRQTADSTAASLERFGYDSQVMDVDFGQTQTGQSHE